MSAPVIAVSLEIMRAELDALLGQSDSALCSRCEASLPLPNDTLCGECRFEIDGAFGDLPGAEP